ncbi:hypothetical protein H6781_01820 [Candidatus Nomurabacteria bacterium]|nr:hypothetical protein [Candidatus Nomurabacteria bacterium]MCB9818476.1 hypothetical protein [Candidatus Nomurabacteria bacterium]
MQGHEKQGKNKEYLMSNKSVVLALGTACSSCEGNGNTCKDCYGVGIEGVKTLGIFHYLNRESGSEHWSVFASFLSEGQPQTVHLDPVAEEWVLGTGSEVPERCRIYFPQEARMAKTDLLVRLGLRERVKNSGTSTEDLSLPHLYDNVSPAFKPAYT